MPYKDSQQQAQAKHLHYLRNKEKVILRNAEHKSKIRKYIFDLKYAAVCADCGGDFPPFALDFDHRRGQKISDVSKLISRGSSLKKVQEEVEKCDIVCRNCHAFRTHANVAE